MEIVSGVIRDEGYLDAYFQVKNLRDNVYFKCFLGKKGNGKLLYQKVYGYPIWLVGLDLCNQLPIKIFEKYYLLKFGLA